MTGIAGPVAALLYLASALLASRRNAPGQRFHLSGWLLGAGALVQMVGFYGLHLEVPAVPLESFPAALSLIAWLIVASYLLSLGVARFRGMAAWVATAAFLVTLASDLGLRMRQPMAGAVEAGAGSHAHVLLSAAGFSLLALASLAGVAYLMQERALKQHHRGRLSFPSLESLDRVEHVTLSLGFPLLTLGVVTGFVWSAERGLALWTWHAVFLLGAWIVYLVPVSLCVIRREHGRAPARSVVVSFGLLAFSWIGVRLLGGGCMRLVIVGFSHRTAPVEIRESYAVAPNALSGINEKLVQNALVSEAALISTCNRTELIAVVDDPDEAAESLLSFFHRELGDGCAEPQHFYELRGSDAIMHIFKVTAGLDSMVLGEAQILGQVKLSYRAAQEARSLGPFLNRLFQRAFRAAKRVRSQTGLGASSVSVARVGVQLTQQLFESLESKRVLLLGAGEMAESALRGLRDAGVEEVAILSRSFEAASRLSVRLAGRPGTLDAIPDELAHADIVLSSLQIDKPILDVGDLRPVMAGRQGRPLLLVDLGIPRNVSPQVNDLQNVYLYDLDDLESVANEGRAARQSAVEPAVEMLLEERDRFEAWCERLPLAPTVRQLLELSRTVAREEVQKAAAQFQGEPADNKEALDHLANRIVSKLMHQPLDRLRREAETGGGLYYAEAVRRLFGLDPEEEDE